MSQTVPLIDFLGKKYFIPKYQRGYCWGKQEMDELLDDLWRFCEDPESGDFYCLQPIVLRKRNEDEFDVLDGQQRLTTLYLVLFYLRKPSFSLKYESRGRCERFLEEGRFAKGIEDSNIDFYRICTAYENIGNWFSNASRRDANEKLASILLGQVSEGSRSVRFIKYEVEKDANPIEIFIRLNTGKIPLTDAELTKALLLQTDKYPAGELSHIKKELSEIAAEWDRIEYALQNDEFWYFLNNKTNDNPTHIEFIFNLLAGKVNEDEAYYKTMPPKHATFLILSLYLQDLMDKEGAWKYSRMDAVKFIWQQVTEYFEHFNEWYQNRKLYHFIGFIIEVRQDLSRQLIMSFLKKSREQSKRDFERFLKQEIAKMIAVNKKRKDASGTEYEVRLENLIYNDEDRQGNDKAEIQKILLVHNVYTTWTSDKERSRFPFHLYKSTRQNQKWSLEHIHAQNSQPVKEENRRSWLQDHIQSLSRLDHRDFESLINRMKELSNVADLKNGFEEIVKDVYSAVNSLSGFNERSIHSISNLCLVDAPTNSRLNNSVFDVKREIIRKRELEGHYIPICTRKAFLKAYTGYPASNAYWTEEDRNCYLRSIKEACDYFMKEA